MNLILFIVGHVRSLQLEEYRRKKEAAIAARKLSNQSHDNPEEDNIPIEGSGVSSDGEERLKSQLAELLETVDGLHRSLNDERYNSSQLENIISELRSELSDSKSLRDAQAELVENVTQEKEKLTIENEHMAQKLDGLESEIDIVRSMLEQAESALEESRRESELSAQRDSQEQLENITRYELQIQDLESQLSKYRDEMDSLSEIRSLMTGLEDENRRLKDEIERFSSTQDVQNTLKQQLEEMSEIALNREDQINLLEQKIDALNNTALDNEKTATEMQEKYEATSSRLEQEVALAVQMKSKINSLEEENRDARMQLEALLRQKEDAEKLAAETLDQLEQVDSLGKQKMNAEVERLQNELNEMMNQLELMLQEREEALRTSQNAEERVQVLERDLIEAAHISDDAIRDKERISEEMKVVMGQMDALMAVKESLESENAKQKEHIESLKSSVPVDNIKEIEDSLAEEKYNRERLEKEVQKLHEMEATYSNQIVEYESRCDTAEGQVVQLQSLVDSLRKDCELQKLEREETEKTVASLKEMISQLQQTSEKNSSSEFAQILETKASLENELHSVKMELQQAILRSQKAESSLAAMSNAPPKVEFKEEQINAMRSELETVREQFNAEKRRAAQLEDFVNRNRDLARTSSTGGNKKMDDDEDMEAAALSGGSAFKPLVGLVRSLPHPLGNNPMLTSIAMKIDKAVVALDARPHFRALLLLYLIIVHILLLA